MKKRSKLFEEFISSTTDTDLRKKEQTYTIPTSQRAPIINKQVSSAPLFVGRGNGVINMVTKFLELASDKDVKLQKIIKYYEDKK
jgi:hypothetical protein